MADETISQGQDVIIGGFEHLRDSDFIDLLLSVGSDTAKVGMFVTSTGENENECDILGDGEILKGVIVAPIIRPSDSYVPSDALADAQWVRVLKPTGGRVQIRGLLSGDDGTTASKADTRISYKADGLTIYRPTVGGLYVGGSENFIDGNIRLAEDHANGDAGSAGTGGGKFAKMYF